MHDVTGTWRLAAAKSQDADGKPLPLPYGPQAIGRIVFTAEGRMMAALSDGRRELPAGAKREYGGYCGDYTFDGKTLTTQVDASPNPAYIGTAQVRRADGAAAAAARDRRRTASPRADLGAHQPGLTPAPTPDPAAALRRPDRAATPPAPTASGRSVRPRPGRRSPRSPVPRWPAGSSAARAPNSARGRARWRRCLGSATTCRCSHGCRSRT